MPYDLETSMFLTLFITAALSVETKVTLDPRIKSIEFTAEGESGLCDAKGDWKPGKHINRWRAKVTYKINGRLEIDGSDRPSIVTAKTDMEIFHALNNEFRSFADTWPALFPQSGPR